MKNGKNGLRIGPLLDAHLCWTDIKRVTDPRSKAKHEIVNRHFPHLKIGYAMRISCKFEKDSFDFVMFFLFR